MRSLSLLALAWCLSGCGSYKKDLQTLCDAPKNAPGVQNANPADRATVMASWVDKNLGSTEGRNLFRGLASVDPAEKGKVLREAAQSEGLTSCAWADDFEAGAREFARERAAREAARKAAEAPAPTP
jgi:hypothetical protein